MSKLLTVFVITLLSLCPFILQASELTGREIALKMDAVDTSMDSSRTAIMLIERRGHQLNRKIESFSKKFGANERMLIRFVEPPDVRGVMYLTWSYEDIEKDDDI